MACFLSCRGYCTRGRRSCSGFVRLVAQLGASTYDYERSSKLSSPLSKEANRHSLSISLSHEDCSPDIAVGGQSLCLQANLFFRLVKLLPCNCMARVVWRLTESLQDVFSLFEFTFGNKPTRGSGKPRGSEKQDQRRQAL